MEFWLSFNNFAEQLQLPVNPSEFRVSTGNEIRVVNIANLGELALIGKGRLAEVQLSSFFPSQWAPYCEYVDIPDPYEAVALIDSWKRSGKPIRLIITETPVNMACAIEGFEWGEQGGTRNVEYTLTLKEFRFVTIKAGVFGVSAPASTRPGSQSKPATYTVKAGDNLSLIAKRVYGDSAKWRTIYDANAKLIGPNPNAIQPGMVLMIP